MAERSQNCSIFWVASSGLRGQLGAALGPCCSRGDDLRQFDRPRAELGHQIFYLVRGFRGVIDDSFKVNRNPVTLREIVLDKLRSAIMNFQLMPGDRLVERDQAIASVSVARRCVKPCVTWSPRVWSNSPMPKARA